jgi:HSP20 family protein
MSIRDLVPLRRKPTDVAKQRAEPGALDAFHREIDRLFSGVFEDFGLPSPWKRGDSVWESGWPAVNVAESDKEVVVTAELPGVDEKNVALELDGDVLTIRGETEEEHEEKGRHWTRVERTSGSFHRAVELPAAVREDGAKATFKRGILTVSLPKAEPDKSKRKVIDIE